MVVAAIALRHRRAAKLRTKHNQCLVQHAAARKIFDQSRSATVNLGGRALDVILDTAVVIPIAVVELDESHATLGQPARQEAVGGKRTVATLCAIQIERAL